MIVIVGIGAIGSVYASALGTQARIAASEERCEKYRLEGLYFNDQPCNFDYFTPKVGDQKADLVIIATKSSGLEDALDLIEPIVGSQTIILPLLNGITSEEITARKYGWSRVLYGYYLGHTSTRVGNRVYQDGHYKTYFGQAANGTMPSEQVERVKAIFDRFAIPYKIPENMIEALWQKFIINVGMNQATAILRCTYGHLQQNTAANNYMRLLMQEASAVATAHGIANSDQMVEKAISLLSTLAPQDGSSMYQDVIGGRVPEYDLFADTVCRMGIEHGISTPYNLAASAILKAL